MSLNNFLFLVFLVYPSLTAAVQTNSSDVEYDIYPFIRVYKNGTIQRFMGTDFVPSSVDPSTRVRSKDTTIDSGLNITARLYLPRNANPDNKIPLLVYFHGGGFFTGSAFSSSYHKHLNSLVAKANVVALSVNYRLAPEHPLPIGYQDSWLALKWVFFSTEPWIKNYVDFRRVHLGGDSAGGNIAHNMAIRAGLDEGAGVVIDGLFLNCPHFWGKKSLGSERTDIKTKNVMESLWVHAYPNSKGLDDPLVNPGLDPNLSRLGCKRVLVYVAGNDILRGRGWNYELALRKSKWRGVVKVVQAQGEEHVFAIRFPDSPNAIKMVNNFATFINGGIILH